MSIRVRTYYLLKKKKKYLVNTFGCFFVDIDILGKKGIIIEKKLKFIK